MTKDWAGRDLVCTCGSTDVVFVEEHEHDGAGCQVFSCRKCSLSIHSHRVQLPDAKYNALLYTEHEGENPETLEAAALAYPEGAERSADG
jgi:hypothetical protein